VSPPGRQRKWTLGAQADEPPLGVEDVVQRVEVARIRSPAVMQDENALRVTGGGPHEVLNRIDLHRSTLTTTRPLLVTLSTFGDLSSSSTLRAPKV
jgi:hypothetical protein